jgi:hypothetical protein
MSMKIFDTPSFEVGSISSSHKAQLACDYLANRIRQKLCQCWSWLCLWDNWQFSPWFIVPWKNLTQGFLDEKQMLTTWGNWIRTERNREALSPPRWSIAGSEGLTGGTQRLWNRDSSSLLLLSPGLSTETSNNIMGFKPLNFQGPLSDEAIDKLSPICFSIVDKFHSNWIFKQKWHNRNESRNDVHC